MLGCVNGSQSARYEVPNPLGAAEHRRSKTEKREDCLTERSEGVPQRPFSAEERRAVGAQRRPSCRGALFFAFFLLGKQKKEGLAR
jgi:hypothetical protein